MHLYVQLEPLCALVLISIALVRTVESVNKIKRRVYVLILKFGEVVIAR